jgi:hypothetical protein
MNTRTLGLIINCFLNLAGVAIGFKFKQPLCCVIGFSSGLLIYTITVVADDICGAIKALKK